jgi:hypothetical protein
MLNELFRRSQMTLPAGCEPRATAEAPLACTCGLYLTSITCFSSRVGVSSINSHARIYVPVAP